MVEPSMGGRWGAQLGICLCYYYVERASPGPLERRRLCLMNLSRCQGGQIATEQGEGGGMMMKGKREGK